ncbi:MAG: carbohydrate binding domain-containing protein, partial [Clostridia bacterium]|nr:carbohydrate binding domain-containing protein [Clostridia bacterium]
MKANDYYDYNLHIKNEKGVDIQQGMYGLFFEDINYSADGGLYAEMIENRSFEAMKSNGNGTTIFDGLYGWSKYGTDASSLTLKATGGLNDNNTHYVEFSSSGAGSGFTNQAYDGICMEQGKTYNVSFFAKKGTFDGKVKATVYAEGEKVAETMVTESLTDEWTKYEATLAPTKTVRYADFVISLDGSGTASFDMISCMPSDAVMGIFRRDLAEKLKAIKPGFLRFPGGCIIEGYNLANRYNWKDTVG